MTNHPPRLVDSPVFILSSIRSGSTLLRCLLDTHPQIHAPHELHLLDVGVEVDEQFAELSMRVAGLDQRELEHLLWDRVLHHELLGSGKDQIVEKTPTNLLRWERVTECWPRARYIFLLRHPQHIVDSAIAGRPQARPSDSTDLVMLFLERMIEARQALAGLTVRYEELTSAPDRVTQESCDHLGVTWSPDMVRYGLRDHGPFLRGIGDFGDRIRSGRVQPGRPLPNPAEVPSSLRNLCQALGY